MPKEKDLPLKVRRYLKELPRSKTKKEAALKAGYSVQTAENATHKIESQVGKSRMHAALEKAGVTDESISKGIKDAMDATTADTRPDHQVRLKSIEIAGKFRRDFEEQIRLTGDINPIVAGLNKLLGKE